MTNKRCFHDALISMVDQQLRFAMQSKFLVDDVVSCSTCGKPCQVSLYYSNDKPLLMIKEEIPWGQMDYYSWTGTEWWED